MKRKKRETTFRDIVARFLVVGAVLIALGFWMPGGGKMVAYGVGLTVFGGFLVWCMVHRAVVVGAIGEWLLGIALRNSLPGKDYKILHNVMMPLDDGTTTQIDFVIVSVYGLFVLEVKTYQGWIFGSEGDSQWTQCLSGGRKKYRFQNPIRQNYAHIKALSDRTGIPMDYFFNFVVFSGSATIKTELPPTVTSFGKVAGAILSYTEPIIKEEQIPDVVDTIRSWDRSISRDVRKAHVRNLKKKHKTRGEENAL